MLVEWCTVVPERSLRQAVRTLGCWGHGAAGRARLRIRRLGPQLTCAALLVAIAATTGLLVWLCWQAAADAQMRADARPEVSSGSLESPLEGSLLGDGRKDSSVVRKKAPPRQGAGGASAGQDASGGGVTLPAPLLASVGSAAAVAAGVGAGWLVLRRFRRPQDEQAVEVLPLPLPPPLQLWAEEDEAQTPGDASPPEQEPPGEDAPVAGADEIPEPVWARAGLPEPTVVVPLQLRGLGDGAAAAPAASGLDADPSPAGGQRLFERRAAARVDYVQDAVLLLCDDQWAVRTLDLSETGLRCRAVPPAEGAAPAPALPKAPSNVRVRVPLDGGVVELRAQVVWRRTTAAGQEAGLTFSGLTEVELDLLRRTCSGLAPATR